MIIEISLVQFGFLMIGLGWCFGLLTHQLWINQWNQRNQNR